MLALAFDRLGGGPLTDVRGFRAPTFVVNTASDCGHTPQYAELQRLWEKYKDRGLVVLGVPCNDFGAQEPGDPAQIQAFCQARYGVTFPLSAKAQIVDVAHRHAFYRSVAAEIGEDQLPRWNFHKYLVDRDGELIGAWPSKTSPLVAEIIEAIEDCLA